MDMPDLTGVSDHTKLVVVSYYLVLKIVGQGYSSVRNGGGLVRIAKSFIFGENVPAPIAKDYSVELSANAPKPPPGGNSLSSL
jgi:hypothetical protein